MRFRFTLDLELLSCEADTMSDWINKLKEQEDTTREHKQREEQLKLRTSRMIDAKLPDFWQACVDSTETQSKRLQEEFPDRSAYATDFKRDQYGFTLRQISGDERRIEASLDKAGQRIKIEISESFRPTSHRELTARLSESDQVHLSNRREHKLHTQPDEAAEWFIRTVCGIKV